MSTPFHPHGPLVQAAPGLWLVDGKWGNSPFGRRMTVIVLGDGLLIHSAIRLDDATMAELRLLGEPRVVVVPNAFHSSEAWFYSERFPAAQVLVPREAQARLREKLPRIDGTVEDEWPASCSGIVERATLRGTRFAEVALLHSPSRTLVLCDACFNMGASDLSPVARVLMRLNDGVDRFGPTRLARWVFISDRAALADSLRPVMDWDFDRVVMSHGRVLETGGRAAMERAFDFLRE
jgi:hypothetical protein